MRLRRKTLLIIGVTLVSLMGVLYSTSLTILLGGFSQVEQQDTRENVKRVQKALSEDLAQLNMTTRDWAEWDETYAFIENGNKAYINTYLNNVSIASLKLNLMLYVDSSGRVIVGKGFDLARQKSTPISHNFKRYLSAKSLLHQSSKESSLTGLILLPEGPILIAARPILKTDSSGPIRGTLIMGRYLNANAIKQLAGQTYLSITIYSVNDTQLPSDFQAVRSSLLNKEAILVQPLSKQTVAGYTLIKDINGQPALLMRVDLPRNIYAQGQVSIYYLFLSLLAVGLVFSGATLLLLEQLVLSRLCRLSSDVRSIGSSGDLSARVLSMTGKDELSSLADTINSMLEALAYSQHKQQESKERYYRYSRILAELTRRQTLEHGDLSARFWEITETAACTLEVERASVWLYDAERLKMQCIDLYERSMGQHSAGMELLAADYPAYSQALEQERTIATEDVRTDPITQKMSESYLSQVGIASMLNAPIYMNGRIGGAICIGHVGASRQWLLEEQNFVGSLADLLSLLLEASERKRSQEELRKTYEELEIRIQERTSELAKANEELQAEIIERHIAEEKLLYEAFHDPLTGLPNRTLFIQRLESAVERAKREKYLLGVLFLDLDCFKFINDRLGHLVGDQLLVAIAHRLQGCLRPKDLVCRLGGDEFTILLENIKSVTDATQIAERIQHELTLPFNLDGHEVFTAASIGIALNTTGYEQPEDLLHDADLSMYRAKALGKGRYEVFNQITAEWALRMKIQK
jgi:diguanylate cyclase (GGDEF)-like protein